MHELSSNLSSTKEESYLSCSNEKADQHIKNSYFQSEHSNEANIFQWRRQHPWNPMNEAPSLVPTSSEVAIGSNTREGNLNRRISTLKRRIEAALDGMELLLRRRPKEPDGEEELERRGTRSVEFLSRFSRNYLFQLRMQVMDLKNQIGIQRNAVTSPGRHTQHQLLLKKLVASYQTAVQGLQACLNQLPGSAQDSAILSKLDQLICCICELAPMKTKIDKNAYLIEQEDFVPQDNLNAKAQNLLLIVRKKRKEREEACKTWKQTAAILAKKHFGAPSATKRKAIFRPITREEKALRADRRVRKQRPIRKLNAFPSALESQETVSELPAHHTTNIEQADNRADTGTEALDPATALELKIIMSRMKDILRGAYVKTSPPPNPTYPPNVRLVCITHTEDEPENVEEPQTNVVTKKSPDYSDANETNFRSSQMEDRANDQTNDTEEDILQAENSEEMQRSKTSSNCTEISAMHYPVSNKRLQVQRRHTPEEQRIIRYRNRFKSYKSRVSEIQRTCEQLLSTVFHEVANELEPSILLDKMYHLELQG